MTKKTHNENGDKWIGVGGKFEPGETADECALREVKENGAANRLRIRRQPFAEGTCP